MPIFVLNAIAKFKIKKQRNDNQSPPTTFPPHICERQLLINFALSPSPVNGCKSTQDGSWEKYDKPK